MNHFGPSNSHWRHQKQSNGHGSPNGPQKAPKWLGFHSRLHFGVPLSPAFGRGAYWNFELMPQYSAFKCMPVPKNCCPLEFNLMKFVKNRKRRPISITNPGNIALGLPSHTGNAFWVKSGSIVDRFEMDSHGFLVDSCIFEILCDSRREIQCEGKCKIKCEVHFEIDAKSSKNHRHLRQIN